MLLRRGGNDGVTIGGGGFHEFCDPFPDCQTAGGGGAHDKDPGGNSGR